MSKLVIFYSWTGNTKEVAKTLAKNLDCDLVEISEKRPRYKGKGFFKAAFQAFFNYKSSINPINKNIADYNTIFLGTPIWAAHITPALNSFISKTDFTNKNVYLFTTCMDNKIEYTSAVFSYFQDKISSRGGKALDSIFIKTEKDQILTEAKIVREIEKWL